MGAGCLKDAADAIQSKGFKEVSSLPMSSLIKLAWWKRFKLCWIKDLSNRSFLMVLNPIQPFAMSMMVLHYWKNMTVTLWSHWVVVLLTIARRALHCWPPTAAQFLIMKALIAQPNLCCHWSRLTLRRVPLLKWRVLHHHRWRTSYQNGDCG